MSINQLSGLPSICIISDIETMEDIKKIFEKKVCNTVIYIYSLCDSEEFLFRCSIYTPFKNIANKLNKMSTLKFIVDRDSYLGSVYTFETNNPSNSVEDVVGNIVIKLLS